MSLVYRADGNIINLVMEKLKRDNGISKDAQFIENSYDFFRSEILFNDLDFQYFYHMIKTGEKEPLLEQLYIEKTLEKMKKFKRISLDAYLNTNNLDKLRDVVAYRDFYFLDYLGDFFDFEVADMVLNKLKIDDLAFMNSHYDKVAFDIFLNLIRTTFKIPGTSITPAMQRILYILSSVRKPKRIIGIGTYCGNAIAWITAPSCGENKLYYPEITYAIDIDKSAVDIAEENFKNISASEHIKHIAEDGLTAIDKIEGTFDYIYLDTDSQSIGKGLYYDLLKKLYPRLEKGGWVLTHDTTHPYFKEQLDRYLDFVRDKSNFTESISFDLDLFGIEVSIK